VVHALNKVDRLSTDERKTLGDRAVAIGAPADAVPISAQKGQGIDTLLGRIEAVLETEAHFVAVELTIPFDRSELVDRFHTHGRVGERTFDEHGTRITGWLPEADMGRFDPFIAKVVTDAAPEADERFAEPALVEQDAAHPAA
jgi:GTP-binding protein HflX